MTAVFRVCQDAADNAALRRLRPHPLSINQSKDSHRNKRLATENKNNHSKAHFLGKTGLSLKRNLPIQEKNMVLHSHTKFKYIYFVHFTKKRTLMFKEKNYK